MNRSSKPGDNFLVKIIEVAKHRVCVHSFACFNEGCKDEVWFQNSEPFPLEQYAVEVVSGVAECASRCHASFPFCRSAVYEPAFFPAGGAVARGYCKYSSWRVNCVANVPLIANYRDDIKTVVHCIYCLSPDTSAVLPRAQQQRFSTNLETPQQPNNIFGSGPLRRRKLVFSVMTFNTWNTGVNVVDGLTKIVRHINLHKPDIVGLQEIHDDKIDALMQLLNNQYKKCNRKNGGNLILSRWPIVDEYYASDKLVNAGCSVELYNSPSVVVNVWNVHLHWSTYGPYTACASDPSTVGPEKIFNCEYKKNDPATSRVHNMLNLMNHFPFKTCVQNVERSPMILLGDFNAPSHLDWTEKSAGRHCGWQFVWPVSKLAENFGFRDSFREINANDERVPGVTWSPIVKLGDNFTREPQDRIDFIYYAGGGDKIYIRPTSSFTYEGSVYRQNSIYPNHLHNDWPSDHNSVITHFEIEF